jgi:hypothetical protein
LLLANVTVPFDSRVWPERDFFLRGLHASNVFPQQLQSASQRLLQSLL